MEGILEKYDTSEAGMFSKGVWKKYFFILHQDVLMLTDLNDRATIIGRMHMTITKVLPEDQTYLDGEIRVNSGLFDVRLKASSIKEKVAWKEALSGIPKKPSYLSLDRVSKVRDDVSSRSHSKSVGMKGAQQEYFPVNPKRKQELVSDNGSYESRHSNQMLWGEMLNMSFNT